VHPKGEQAQVLHGSITCFTVKGDTAWVGGHRSDYEPTDMAWQVVDKGEGQSDPDEVGLFIEAALFGYEPGFAQDFCDNTPRVLDFGLPFGELPLSILLTPIRGGNIQITLK